MREQSDKPDAIAGEHPGGIDTAGQPADSGAVGMFEKQQ